MKLLKNKSNQTEGRGALTADVSGVNSKPYGPQM